jgi:hypothetical protein
MVTWERSKDGYTRSHEHRFDIEPLFLGHTTAQAYQLNDCHLFTFPLGDDRSTVHDTQSKAKQHADAIVRGESNPLYDD